jgi:NADH dehydrogenase
MDRLLEGVDAVVHLVGIILEDPRKQIAFDRIHVEGTRRVIDAMARAGTRRLLHVSALGARADARADYHRTKWRAEQLVRESGLSWTLFRPSLIHGERGEFMRMAAEWARGRRLPWIFMPYFGRGLLGFGGAGRLQPIRVEDVSRAIVESIDKPETIHRSIDLAGPHVLTWPELHRAVAQAVVGKSKPIAPIPAWWARVLTSVIPDRILGTNASQVLMSQEDNTCDIQPMIDLFGWHPDPFEPSLARYAARL